MTDNLLWLSYLKNRVSRYIGLTPCFFSDFDRTKTVFIHIPKSGGISVVNSLYGRNASHHRKALEFKKENEKKFEQYYTFSIIREPIARFISAYNYLNNGGRVDIDKYYKKKFIKPYKNINDFVCNGLRGASTKCMHFEKQVDFISDKNNQIIIDEIFKIEDMEKVAQAFSARFGRGISIPVHNTSEGIDKTVLNENSLSILREVYSLDFELYKSIGS